MKKLYISFITMLFISSLTSLIKAQDLYFTSALHVECTQLDRESVDVPPNTDCLYNISGIETKLVYLNNTLNLDINVIVSNTDCDYIKRNGDIYGPSDIESQKNIWFKNGCTNYLIIVEPNSLQLHTSNGVEIDISDQIDNAYSNELKGSLYNISNYNKIILALNYIIEQSGGYITFDFVQPNIKVNPELYSLYSKKLGVEYDNYSPSIESDKALFNSLSNLGYLYVPVVTYHPTFYNYLTISSENTTYFNTHLDILKGIDNKLNDFVVGHSIMNTVHNQPNLFEFHRVRSDSINESFSPVNHFDRITNTDKEELIYHISNNQKELSPEMFSLKMEYYINELLTANNHIYPSNESSSDCIYFSNSIQDNGLKSKNTIINPEDEPELEYSDDNLSESEIDIDGVTSSIKLDKITIQKKAAIYDIAGLTDDSQTLLENQLRKKEISMQNTKRVLIDGEAAYKTKVYITSEESKSRFTNQNSLSDYDILMNHFNSFDFSNNPKVISLFHINIDWTTKILTLSEKFNGQLVTEKSIPIDFSQDGKDLEDYLSNMISIIHTGRSPSKFRTVSINGDEVSWGIIGEATLWERITLWSGLQIQVSAFGSIPEDYFFTTEECSNCVISRLRIPKVLAGICNGINEELITPMQLCNILFKLGYEIYKEPKILKTIIKNFTLKTLFEDYVPCYANESNCTPESKLKYWRPKQITAWAFLILTFGKGALTKVTKISKGLKVKSLLFSSIDDLLEQADFISKASKEMKASGATLSDGPTKINLNTFFLDPKIHKNIVKICFGDTKAMASVAKILATKHIPDLANIANFYKKVKLVKKNNQDFVKLPDGTLITKKEFIDVTNNLAKHVTHGPVGNQSNNIKLEYFHNRTYLGPDGFPNDLFSINDFHSFCYKYPKTLEKINTLNKFKLLQIYQSIQVEKLDIGDINFENLVSTLSNSEKKISNSTINILSKFHQNIPDKKNAVELILTSHTRAVKENAFSGSLHDWVMKDNYFKFIFKSASDVKCIEHTFLGGCWESGLRNSVKKSNNNWIKNRLELFKAVGRKNINEKQLNKYIGFTNLPIEVELNGKIFKPEPDLVFIKFKDNGDIADIILIDNKLKKSTGFSNAQNALREAINDKKGTIRIDKKNLRDNENHLDKLKATHFDVFKDYSTIQMSGTQKVEKVSFHKVYLFKDDPILPVEGLPRDSKFTLKDLGLTFTPIEKNGYEISGVVGAKLGTFKNLLIKK